MKQSSGILKSLLERFFQNLEASSIEYCVIGNYQLLPDHTDNDVDFWVADTSKSLELLLQCAQQVGLNLYMQNKTAVGSNNYFYASNGQEFEIIKIDLMSETAYKSLVPIVPSEQIKNNRVKYNDFFVANENIESVMHLLYPLVTFGVVKEKYKEKIQSFASSEKFNKTVCEIVGSTVGKPLLENAKNGDWAQIENNSAKVKRALFMKMLVQINLERVFVFIKFVESIVLRTVRKNGIVIGFTGIDGAGKSTIKEHIVENSDRFFAKNRRREYYWRPFLLPKISKTIGVKGQSEKYDDSGRRVITPSFFNGVKNLVKYIYYLVDFVFGQMKYFICSHTGGVVVFDRYHFDNIIYPERFGFSLNKPLMRFFDKYVVPQPDILFYFTAESNVLYNRKKELDLNEIESQKQIYKDEMSIRKDIVQINTDGTLEESLHDVLLRCFELMHKRLS